MSTEAESRLPGPHPRQRTMLLVLLLALAVLGTAASATVEGLGHAEFPNSGSPEAQAPFLRGVLLLHSFEYEDAAEAFREAQAADPDFALAYWGEAMTHYRPIWHRLDREQALAILERLGPDPEERRAKAPTERERGFLAALEVLLAPGEALGRRQAYAEAMEGLARSFPEDLEAAAFLAVAILGSVPERDFRTYMRAAAVAEEVFAANPRHPGAAHYLIHAYDDPVHAPLGLRPARVYAEIAPEAAHALHMPSHVFLALGMWEEVVASNLDAFAAAEARRAARDLGLGDRDYHALFWLQYALLQLGRHDQAREHLETVEADSAEHPAPRLLWHRARMRAVWLVDAGGPLPGDPPPPEPGTGDPEAVAAELFARGYVAALAGEPDAALGWLERLRETAAPAPPPEGEEAAVGHHHHAAEMEEASPAVSLMGKQLEAVIAFAQGRHQEALASARSAADAEEALPYGYGPPLPVKPAREMLGELLLHLGRPEEAAAELERALLRAPGRAVALAALDRATGADAEPEPAGQGASSADQESTP